MTLLQRTEVHNTWSLLHNALKLSKPKPTYTQFTTF